KSTHYFGQVAKIELDATVPTKKVARVGDTSKKTSYQPTEATGSFDLYSEYDPDETALLLGVAKPGSGGWVGTEVIQLVPSIAAYDIVIEVYTDNSSSATKVGAYTITNFKPTGWKLPIGADSDITGAFTFSCDYWAYTPAAGVGA